MPAALLILQVVWMYREALGYTGGAISYPIDDPFIHLALAKHIAFDGVYGVSAQEFSPASSSIGWPFLLAAEMLVLGAKTWLPLATNAVLGVLLVFVVDANVRHLRPGISALARIAAGFAMVLATPLAIIVIVAMEHTAHMLATLGLISAASSWLGEDDLEAPKKLVRPWHVASWALAVTLCRYEGMFVVAIVAGLALLRHRRWDALWIVVAGAIPIVAFGLYSKAHGATFMPSSVLLKSDRVSIGGIGEFLRTAMNQFGKNGAVLVVTFAAAALAFDMVKRRGFWSPLSLALTTTVTMIVTHVTFAKLGWWFRYEAYLLATGIVFGVIALADRLPSPRVIWAMLRSDAPRVLLGALALVMLAMPLRARAKAAMEDTPVACRNTYEQQVQMATFLARFFPKARVVVNDVGAVSWMRDVAPFDLAGLTSPAIAKVILTKPGSARSELSHTEIEQLTVGAEVAILFAEWFPNRPRTWLRVGHWRIQDGRSPAQDDVTIYATDPASYPEIIRALRDFAPELPKTIAQDGRYTEHLFESDRIRSGDRVIVRGDRPPLLGSFEVDAEGFVRADTIGKVFVRGSTIPDVRSALEAAIAKLPKDGAPPPSITGVEHVESRRPSATLVLHGRAPQTSFAMNLAGALAEAGASASDAPLLYVWRENRDGSFVKLSASQLDGGALRDGDIVVLPSAGAVTASRL